MRKSNNSSGAWAEVHGILGDVTKGDPGKSAYEIAVEHGFEGTEEEWLAYVQANADRAVSAERSAVDAKEAAQYASDEAQGFSESASTSAGVAHTEAEAAAESAARAGAAATSAVESRDGAAMSAVDAADSATAAAASATEAASQALLATGRADEARQSQIDAHVSEVHCEEMWLDFQRFPDLAKQYAEEAALSAQNAADSETATAASAQAAAQSATAAAGSATASAGSASESASSASDSADSASAAAASAAAAADSATAAAGSATQAEAAVTRAVSEAVTAAQTAVQSQINSKLDVDGKAVDSAHADNADTVNNHTVLSDVPANAVFTDTTYQQMTDQELDDGISTQGRVVAANTIATFILNVIADVINSAPAALDTLEELAAAINDDPDFHVTVMNEIGKKLDKAGGVVTGDLTVNGTFTADVTGNVSGNAATATKATGDKNGNDIVDTYIDKTSTQTISGKKTFTGETHIYSETNTTSGQGLYIHGSGTNEGGQINLCAPDQGTTYNGLFLDNYKGDLRLIGIPSADGKTKTGGGTALTINPYNKTITGGYTFTGNVTGSSGSCTGNAATATNLGVKLLGSDYEMNYTDFVSNTIFKVNSFKADATNSPSYKWRGFDFGDYYLRKHYLGDAKFCVIECISPRWDCVAYGKFWNGVWQGWEIPALSAANADTATKLATARTINIQDSTATNTGTGASFDGSGNATIKLPATINANITGDVTGNVSGSSGSCTGNAATASKAAQLTTARTVDGVSFNGTGNIAHYGVCSTEAATVEKTVDCPGFVLATGAEINIRFVVTNTAANPTLNVNSTGAKAIYYRAEAINAYQLGGYKTYRFVYNGSHYALIGDLNTDTNNATAQNISTTNATYPILLGNTANATANIGNKAALFGSGVKVNPSTSTVVATTFQGALSGNASTATKIKDKTIPVVSSFNSSTGVLALTSLS